MLKSYVGIANPHGLECFLPEHDHVVRFLTLRALRHRRRRSVCFWAVVNEEVAHHVERELAEGYRADALFALGALATELGLILPEEKLLRAVGL